MSGTTTRTLADLRDALAAQQTVGAPGTVPTTTDQPRRVP
jgi:hypothetical protein